jgi:uncharacterized membrane protein YbhN (UPF0104 family)
VSILVDRAAGIVGLVLVAWGAYAVWPSLPGRIWHALLAITVAGALAALVLAGLLAARRSARRLVPRSLARIGADVRGQLLGYAGNRRLVAEVVALSVAAQALVVVETWLLARAIDVRLSLVVAAAASPVVLVLTMLPISIGGFGVRESSFVVLLAAAGVRATDAALISVLTLVCFAIASLPGAAVLLRSGMPSVEPPRLPEPAA